MFTGSGFPMRFADANGSLIDVYQAATQLTDESEIDIRPHIKALLDGALGSDGYYGVFTANMHTDDDDNPGADRRSSPRPRRAACPWSRPCRCSTGSTAATTRRSADLSFAGGQLRFSVARRAPARAAWRRWSR